MADKRPEPISVAETCEPADTAALAELVRGCYEGHRAVYPVGGGTSLDFGLPARRPGIALRMGGLRRVIDYPARDMTVTVEAGLPMQELAELLRTNRQRLPIDVPNADRATVGGVVATNWNGPRRYGQGTVRDHVIGIHAVDGRGRAFKGGGRVVKNVAGYDFCKLLTGSLGTLGVITQVTFKLKPEAERLAVIVGGLPDLQRAESALAALVQSKVTPVAIELLAGPTWRTDPAVTRLPDAARGSDLWLAVALEGTAVEVDWMAEQLRREWWEQGLAAPETLLDADATGLMQRLADFPTCGPSPLVVKASVVPSAVTRFLAAAKEVDRGCSIQAHAGNGIVLVRCAEPPAGGVTQGIIGTLRQCAVAAQGTLAVLSSEIGEATQASIWGTLSAPQWLMTAVKREFDPHNILNPDRFVYA